MRVLVTGGLGFIGSNLVRRLDGVEVHVYDLLNGYDLRTPTPPPCEDADVLVHLAALGGVRSSEERPYDYIETNVKGTLHALQIAERLGVERVVLASSSSVYGRTLTEDEAVPCKPLSLYGATKTASEGIAHYWHSKTGIDVDVVRPFTVYGPGGRTDMLIGQCIERLMHGGHLNIYGDGSAKRRFTYVGDVVEAIWRCIVSPPRTGIRTLNLGHLEEHSVMQVIDMLEQISGRKIETIVFREASLLDAPQLAVGTVCNSAEKELDWTPTTKIYSGLVKTWEAR